MIGQAGMYMVLGKEIVDFVKYKSYYLYRAPDVEPYEFYR